MTNAYRDAVLADSPSGYWRLGETSGTVADNAEGTAARDGTYTGTYSLGAASLIASDTGNKALSVGGGGWVNVPFTPAIADTVSLEALVNWTASGATQCIISRGSNQWVVYVSSTGFVRFEKNNGGLICASSVALTPGVTYHIVVTKAGATSSKIWINGDDRTGTVTDKTLTANFNSLGIAADRTGTEKFAGVIDEVAVYSTVLTQARVVAHYSAAVTIESTFVPTTIGAARAELIAAIIAAGMRATDTAGAAPVPYVLVSGAGIDIVHITRGAGHATYRALCVAGPVDSPASVRSLDTLKLGVLAVMRNLAGWRVAPVGADGVRTYQGGEYLTADLSASRQIDL